jgi:hypothetical protein
MTDAHLRLYIKLGSAVALQQNTGNVDSVDSLTGCGETISFRHRTPCSVKFQILRIK